MSSRKRRKISKHQETDNKEDSELYQYRVKVLGLLGSRLERYEFLEKWYKPKSSNKDPDYIMKHFGDLDNEQKIKRILHYKSRGKNEVKRALNSSDYKKLKELFVETIGKKGIPAKQTISQTLADKFFDEEPEFLKRETEGENLEMIEDLRDLQAVEFDGVYVNVDILQEILSYFYYDRILLFEIGSVCKGFYLTILCTWKKVTVTKRNLYDVSLLVLQNVREIRISEESTSEKLILQELKYLYKNLNKHLRKVTFRCTLIGFKKHLEAIKKLYYKKTNNNDIPFREVVTIKLSLTNKSSLSTYKKLSQVHDDSFSQLNIGTLFPCLTTFQHPMCLSLLQNIKTLRKLKIKRFPGKLLRPGYRRATRTKREDGVIFMESVYPTEKFHKYVFNSSSFRLRELVLTTNWSTSPYLPGGESDLFLNTVFQPQPGQPAPQKGLEKLDLTIIFPNNFLIRCSRPTGGINVDFSFLSQPMLSCVEDLSIRGQFENDSIFLYNSSSKWRLNPIVSTDFFETSLSKMTNLRRLVIITEALINSKSVLSILSRGKNLKHFFAVFSAQEDDEMLDDMISAIPKLENGHVHLEVKVQGKQPKNPNAPYHSRTFLEKFRDRDCRKQTLVFGIFTLNGLSGGQVEVDYFTGEMKKKDQEEEEEFDGIYKTIFGTIDHITDNLGILLLGERKKNRSSSLIRKVRIITKVSESQRILNWKGVEEVLVDEHDMKKMNIKDFNPGGLMINEGRTGYSSYWGAIRTISWSNRKIESFVVQEFMKE